MSIPEARANVKSTSWLDDNYHRCVADRNLQPKQHNNEWRTCKDSGFFRLPFSLCFNNFLLFVLHVSFAEIIAWSSSDYLPASKRRNWTSISEKKKIFVVENTKNFSELWKWPVHPLSARRSFSSKMFALIRAEDIHSIRYVCAIV